jgi:hypothetical protein
MVKCFTLDFFSGNPANLINKTNPHKKLLPWGGNAKLDLLNVNFRYFYSTNTNLTAWLFSDFL